MAVFSIPESGLVLNDFCSGTNDNNTTSIRTQIMQLDLADGTIDELFKCARKGNPIHVAFGKSISLQYGTKQRHLDATLASSNVEIFTSYESTSNVLQLAGRVSHTLAMQRAEQAMANTDDALAKLQSSLASAKHAKESNQIHFIPDGSKLPPAKKQTMQSLKSSKGGASSSSLHSKDRLLNKSTVQSTSSGPRNSASKTTPQSSNPYFANVIAQAAEVRLNRQTKAIRTPMIHLLAMRSLSTKYLAQKLNCPQDIVEKVLEKVGRPGRIDPSKMDLNDKTYKELDVWAFPYPEASERENAIQRSIAAFDRMRMSQEDPKWQLLFPKEERNKGNTLSRLNHLAKGAIQQSSTPRIHVQHPEELVDDKLVDNASGETDRKGHLTPKSSEPMARTKSNEPMKKRKASEKDGQAKRLVSNGPKKATAAPKEKEAHPAVKKGGSKKASAPKSEEFVRDSDEEDGLEESMAVDALKSPPRPVKNVAPSPTLKGVTSKVAKKPIANNSTTPKPIKHESNIKVTKPSKPVHVVQASFPNLKSATPSDVKTKEEEAKRRAEIKAHPKKIPSSPAATPGAKARMSEAANQQGSTAMQKSLSRNRQGSSPHKPSPLGSSPPTNASEFGSQRQNGITPPSSTSSSGKKITSNPSHAHARSLSSDSTLKPNSAHLSDSSRPSSSDTSLKRKANDLDSGIHNHRSTSPFVNGHASPYANGTGRVMHNPAKKRKSSSEEDNTDTSNSPPSEHERRLQAAQRFKTLHAKYEKAYREVMDSPDASPDQVQLVSKMHVRLEELKRNIARGNL